MLDIHMIPTVGFEQGYLEQAARLTHPMILVHRGIFVPGDLRLARLRSYSLGSNPYVSWIDPDDKVLDVSWVEAALALMESDGTISAIYPRWRCTIGRTTRELPIHTWKREGFNEGTTPIGHHLTIMRRQNVMSSFHVLSSDLSPRFDTALVRDQARYGRCVADPALAYHWIVSGVGASRTLLSSQ